MNELIKVENGNVALVEDAVRTIVEIENMIKGLKAKKDEYTATLLEAMEANDIKKFDNEKLTITYIAPSDRETFDSKKFKEEHQDLYDEYVSMSKVKSSIRIKVK